MAKFSEMSKKKKVHYFSSLGELFGDKGKVGVENHPEMPIGTNLEGVDGFDKIETSKSISEIK